MKSSAALAELNRVYNQSLNSPDYALQTGHEGPQCMPMPEMQKTLHWTALQAPRSRQTVAMLSLALQG